MKDSTEDPIRVAIVDDHAGIRAGIIRFLDEVDDIVVVGEGATGIEAIQLTKTKNPDVLLLDVELPALKGPEVVKRLHEMALKVQVLAVSSYDDPYHIFGMLEHGAAGYITKDEVPQFLLAAVRYVASKRSRAWLSPKLKKRLPLAEGAAGKRPSVGG